MCPTESFSSKHAATTNPDRRSYSIICKQTASIGCYKTFPSMYYVMMALAASYLVGMTPIFFSEAFSSADHTAATAAAMTRANQKSPFLDTGWQLRLDIGLEPGSFVSRYLPEWGATGAHLGIPLELRFTSHRQNAAQIPDNCNLRLVGDSPSHPLDVYQLKVSPTFPSTFVSGRGEESVKFSGGGYSMERSSHTVGEQQKPKPRFLLRFWMDCTSGATRNDVVVEPGTRLFGTIPVWDDPVQIAKLQVELANIKQQEDPGASDDSSFKNTIFQGRQKQMENDEVSSAYRQEQIERLLPLPGSFVDAASGVTCAPKGSLVMPHGDTYLIIGSFSMRPPR
jgi:hypothetical protein